MWEKLGLTVFDIENMPWQMVEDIETIMRVEAKEEQARIDKAQRKK